MLIKLAPMQSPRNPPIDAEKRKQRKKKQANHKSYNKVLANR